MRNFIRLLFASILFLNGLLLQAQDKTITGVVRDDNGSPMEGVSVTVKGTTRGVQTNASGSFSIQAAKGNTLVVTYVGFISREVTVGDATTVQIRLDSDGSQMEEVVVAMDLKRKPKELGYSTQQVKGPEIQETQRENFLNSLQGRVAGLTINPTSGNAGASSGIVLRGFNSLSLSNEPLFVVDGIIIDNQTVNETSNGGQGVGLASDRPNRNNDYTNRIADINPNDIASVTILKGPEATALYGSQASSGAILITTKKAKSGKLAVQYDNSFRIQAITRFPETLNKYSNGQNGAPDALFLYYGPEYPEGTKIHDNKKYFFKTGFAQTHNVGTDFGFKNSIFRFSASYFDQQGVIPNNNYKRLNFRLSNTTKIGKMIEIVPSIAYVRSTNDKVLRSAGGYLLSLLAWPDDNDIRNYADDNGMKLPLFQANVNGDLDNPLFNVNKNPSRDETDRYTATLGINLKPFDWLFIAGRFGYDTYNMDGYTRYHPQSNYFSAALYGEQDNFYRKYKGYNHTITATVQKKFGDFSTRLMVGTMWQDYETQMYAIKGNFLIDSIGIDGQVYKNGQAFPKQDFDEIMGSAADSGSTRPGSRIRLLRNQYGQPNLNIIRQFAYFGEAAVSYKDVVFLSYSHRIEEASTLPRQNRNYNYPAFSLSVIVSDIIPQLKNVSLLNYWKVRGSRASTARLNTAYSTQSVFVNNFASGGGLSYGFVNNNPDLAPEKQSTFEVGTELKLFKNRVGFDATYYNTLNKGQIIENFRLSYATGFVLNTQNAASTRNEGFEISIDADLVRKTDFSWNVRFNFNRMWNKVIDMPKNVAEYYIADTWLYGNARGGLVLNGATTSITAFGYMRNDDGDILINPSNGLPITEGVFKVRGDRNPDFTLGTTNQLSYKNWRLSFLWDLKVGGDIYNGTNRYLTILGKSNITADRYTPRVIEGVLQDGQENSDNPTRNTISLTPAYLDDYYTMPEEAFIEKDVNWLRLRDVSINYTLPSKLISRVKGLKTLSVFLTGNDLILITNYTGADPAVNGNTAGSRGVGAFGFDYGTLPTPISVNIGFRAGF
jgi:TonB-linked SusC/RagA family outer membrane protein